MSKSNSFYAIEGDNGVGKSSVIRGLSKMIQFCSVSTPTKGYGGIRKYIHERDCTHAKFFYYLSSIFDVTKEIEEGLETSNVICDRYLASTFIDFLILSGNDFEKVKGLYRLVTEALIMPKKTILLKCDHEVRVKRVKQRKSLSPANDNLSREYSRKTDEYYGIFSSLERNWHTIDTTSKDVDEIIDKL